MKPSEEGNDMTETRPILAVTMGDPAGIGPEIAVRALLSPEVRDVLAQLPDRRCTRVRARAVGVRRCRRR